LPPENAYQWVPTNLYAFSLGFTSAAHNSTGELTRHADVKAAVISLRMDFSPLVILAVGWKLPPLIPMLISDGCAHVLRMQLALGTPCFKNSY